MSLDERLRRVGKGSHLRGSITDVSLYGPPRQGRRHEGEAASVSLFDQQPNLPTEASQSDELYFRAGTPFAKSVPKTQREFDALPWWFLPFGHTVSPGRLEPDEKVTTKMGNFVKIHIHDMGDISNGWINVDSGVPIPPLKGPLLK
ncbi:MAG: hypothetical protein HY344_00230 [Candidatus Levybacteria bacterium]|nr:hypothetical protein [Candidatus Levybacteria bacterium]